MKTRAAGKIVASFVAALVAVAAGCGSDQAPAGVAGSGGPAVAGSGGDGGKFSFDADALKPPGCGVGPDGGVCDCVDSPLLVDPPNFYFVLDRSGSMGEDGKWDTIRVALSEIMQGIGPRAQFGAAVFPGVANGCATGNEIMSVRLGDTPSGSFGPNVKYLVEATRAVGTGGGTPTAATLGALVGHLGKLPGKTFAILATDGGPNCRLDGASCGAEACILNIEGVDGCKPTGPACCDKAPSLCLDAEPTVSAVAKLRAAGVPTFVIGVPGSQAYATLLDRLAVAGGTAQPGSPRYYRVDKADKGDLLAALRTVAAKIVATCSFELRKPPTDASRVNVYLDEVLVPRDGGRAWTLEGKTVTLAGDTGARVMRGDVLDVRIIMGCPTVEAR